MTILSTSRFFNSLKDARQWARDHRPSELRECIGECGDPIYTVTSEVDECLPISEDYSSVSDLTAGTTTVEPRFLTLAESIAEVLDGYSLPGDTQLVAESWCKYQGLDPELRSDAYYTFVGLEDS